MEINFGIIGYGFMGHCHKDTLAKYDISKLIAVCDIDESRFDDLSKSVQTFLNIDEFLKVENLNTVIISAPNHEHLNIVKKCAKAKKNIICEKPVALSVAEFDQMVEVCKENGVLLTVHQQRRWDEDYRIIKEIYDSKKLGEIFTVKASIYGFNGNMHDWHIYKKFGGGMLYDWGVHLIDQILFMIKSKIVSIYADIKNVINEEVDDYFDIFVKFENGESAHIELGTYMLTDKEKWFEKHWYIGGNKGSGYVDGFFPEGKIVKTSRLLTNVAGKITMSHAGPTRSFGPPPNDLLIVEDVPKVNVKHEDFFENYFKVVEGTEELVVKCEQVRRVLVFMDAVRESAKTGNSIKFE